jgi:hypothetical protein
MKEKNKMSWFNHYDVTPDMGLREAINTVLDANVRRGDGLAYESNYYEVESWGLSCLKPVDLTLGWSKAGETFQLEGKVSRAEMTQLVDMVECLTEYVLLNDSRYSEMESAKVEEQLTEIANEHEVDAFRLITAYWDANYFPETEDGEVSIAITDERLDELIQIAKEDGNTWDAHYNSGEYHHPEACSYCEEAKSA